MIFETKVVTSTKLVTETGAGPTELKTFFNGILICELVAQSEERKTGGVLAFFKLKAHMTLWFSSFQLGSVYH